MPRLLIATNNAAKVLEFRRLLAKSGWELVTPGELGLVFDVDETGARYEDNARLKALAGARASDLTTLGDDSGIEVDALAGAPGMRSARYAGEGASDESNRRKLLRELEGKAERSARFRCLLVLIEAGGREHVFEGVCEGTIAEEERGAHGFGYDPVFIPADHPGLAMAELSDQEKDRASHRGRALAAALPTLHAIGQV